MLKVLGRIIRDVDAAPDFSSALGIIVQRVLVALDTEACSIFLYDHRNADLVLMATKGLNQSAVGKVRVKFGQGLIGLVAERDEPINIDNAPEHPNYLKVENIEEEEYLAFLGAPIIHHGEILGVIVVQQEDARRFDENEEAFLVTVTAQLAGIFARAESSGAIKKLFEPELNFEEKCLAGLSGAPGVGIGKGVVVYPLADLDAVPDREIDNMQAELDLFQEALADAKDEMRILGNRIAQTVAEDERELFQAYIRILEDKKFSDDVEVEIRSGQWAQGALRRVIKSYVSQFRAMDNEYMRERAADVRELGQRVLSYLQRGDRAAVSYHEKTILVGEEVSAANIAEVPEGRLAGIVSSTGSSSSHVAILAKALRVPCAMGVGELPFSELQGVDIIVDGYYGDVYLKPIATVLTQFQDLADQERSLDEDLESLHDLPAQTTDKHKISLLVNTGLAADVGLSLTAGAEGVGLYRTEVPFMVRDTFPSSDDQRRIYRQLLRAFAPLPVVMRTLDIGGDKPLPYFPVEEENPFLGWRGLRISLDHPDIFLVQVRSMMRASAEHQNLRIMLPMVTDVVEVDKALELIDKAYTEVVEEGYEIQKPLVGIMIEVPSAVYQARQLASRVDFLSVGSNDLTQYLLAVDRNNSRVASLYRSLHPAVLKALLHIVASAHAEKKPVSICGEMASDPAAVILLLAMGFDSLSMNAASLPRMKWVVRTLSMKKAKELLAEALEQDTASGVRRILESALDQMGLGGLIRAGRY